MNVFLKESDFEKFLEIVDEDAEIYQFSIHSFCLMNNRYHILLKTTNVNLSLIMKQINSRYGIYFNGKYKRVGPLWQGRFKSWYGEVLGRSPRGRVFAFDITLWFELISNRRTSICFPIIFFRIVQNLSFFNETAAAFGLAVTRERLPRRYTSRSDGKGGHCEHFFPCHCEERSDKAISVSSVYHRHPACVLFSLALHLRKDVKKICEHLGVFAPIAHPHNTA